MYVFKMFHPFFLVGKCLAAKFTLVPWISHIFLFFIFLFHTLFSIIVSSIPSHSTGPTKG